MSADHVPAWKATLLTPDQHVASAGTVIEWLADCFDVGLAAMALAFADQFDFTGLPARNSRIRGGAS